MTPAHQCDDDDDYDDDDDDDDDERHLFPAIAVPLWVQEVAWKKEKLQTSILSPKFAKFAFFFNEQISQPFLKLMRERSSRP